MRARARVTAAGTAVALVALLLAAAPGATAQADAGGPAPVEQRPASMVTADSLPTVQIDSGVVWTQVIAGDTVFAGGSFQNARPAGAAPGVGLMPRANLLAYSLKTGVATDFAPTINGAVKSLALSPDKRTLYVGGSFTQVNGESRFNLAAFDVATGALLSFKAPIGGSYVNAIAVTDSTVYVGGLIGAAKGVARKNLAAVSRSGALLAWAPTTDRQVDAITMTPDGSRLIIGGRFGTLNGSPQGGLAALDPVTGVTLPWTAGTIVTNGAASGRAGIWSLTTDGNSVYAAAWAQTSGQVLEGAIAADPGSGALRWLADCHGDHYGIYSDGTTVYTTNHVHDCETIGGFPNAVPAPGNQQHVAVYTAAAKGTTRTTTQAGYGRWGGNPAPALVSWFPTFATGTATGMGQSGWTITGNGEYVVIGGEFPSVNGAAQQGIARFSTHPDGGAKQGPRLSGTGWTPTAATDAGTTRISIPNNWDRDDLNLRYELWEQGGAAPVDQTDVPSPFWTSTPVTLTASGIAPGSTHTYTVVARDGDGNIARSAPVTVVDPRTPAADQFVAQDAFGRDVTTGWGTADIGGPWSGSTDLSVSNGTGWISVGAGQTRTATLGTAATDSSAHLAVTLSRVPDGGGVHVNYAARKTAGGEYRAKVRVTATGAVVLSVGKVVGTTETLLATKTVPSLTYAPGTRLEVRVSTTSTAGTTVVSARVWASGSAEPTAWTVSAGDSQPELQGSGQVGVSAYLSGTTTGGPLTVGVDDLDVR
ncbi:MAG: hypothetical protein J0J05_08265 [Microbacterium sp.]|uniref:hypothetical protein n=1 Tax=Microbacterium sp. TaxID=51671 RepID=UPI001ACB473C|nr:hypothetical protein [Microbacterium sp.]MBN9153962.1 hypothetical protein [Microbacterium sp.]